MKQELEDALVEEFPFMSRKPAPREKFGQNMYHSFGIEAGDGWYELLRGLCREITEAYERAGRPVDLLPVQIKEKFGTLCFYWEMPDYEPEIHAIDCLNGPSLRIHPKNSDFLNEINRIVGKWEDQSDSVCERCGKEGTLRTDLPWVQTLCEDCYNGLGQQAKGPQPPQGHGEQTAEQQGKTEDLPE